MVILWNALISVAVANPATSTVDALVAAQPVVPPAATPAAAPALAEGDAPPATEGILPVPDYSGEWWGRQFLTGDWGGTRAKLAEKGVQIELDWNQYVQSVVDGGRDEATEYGGKGDYLVWLDLQKMGVMPGGLLKIRAESRYGESVNSIAGPILAVNNDLLFPLTDTPDEDVPFAITSLNYTQFLSAKFAVFLGKIDTLDSDQNEFASGRGTSQFQNSNFLYNSTLALRMPYSTLGAGLIVMPNPNVTIVSTLMNTLDSSTTSGFDDFGDGTTWTTEASIQHDMGRLPGGQNIGFLYSFDQDFTKLGGQLIFEPGAGLSPQTEDDTWAVYWSSWQYVFAEDSGDKQVSASNGQADLQGMGFFSRFGFADDDTNPVEWSFSGGIGGRGVLPSRDDDTYGFGWYYSSLEDLRLSGIVGIEDAVQGFEAFYDIALTPAAHLTFDAQFVEAATTNLDDAVVLGARLGVSF